MEKFTLETKQVSFLFCKLGVQALAPFMGARVIEHGMDLGGRTAGGWLQVLAISLLVTTHGG